MPENRRLLGETLFMSMLRNTEPLPWFRVPYYWTRTVHSLKVGMAHYDRIEALARQRPQGFVHARFVANGGRPRGTATECDGVVWGPAAQASTISEEAFPALEVKHNKENKKNAGQNVRDVWIDR